MTPLAIQFENVSKVYRLYENHADRLKEAFHPLRKRYHRDFFALRDISFEIPKGGAWGIIGVNGSGKSTLLKIVSGVLSPTSGRVAVDGRISALLELGAGFNPDLTGAENVFLNGTIMGFTRAEMEQKFDSIASFADIGPFLHQPVKSYSSGMFVRLAFAVATSIEPEIFVVDEALAVGDMFFQAKCSRRIKSMVDNDGVTLLFVSHEMSAVKSNCSDALYLDQGKVREKGKSGFVCDLYTKTQRSSLGLLGRLKTEEKQTIEDPALPIQDELLSDQTIARFRDSIADSVYGSGRATLLNVLIKDEQRRTVSEVTFGEKLTLSVFYKANEALKNLVVAAYIRDMNRLEIMGTNSLYEGTPIENVEAGVVYRADFVFDNVLKAGNYSVKIILADNVPTEEFYEVSDNATVFKSSDLPGRPIWSLLNPPFDFQHEIVHEQTTLEGAVQVA